MHIALPLQRPLATPGLRPTRPAGLLRALPALHRRRRRPTIAASAALSPALPVTLTAATAVVTCLAASAARAVVMVAAAGAAATVAALVATGAWASTTASHPAVWALLASFLGSRLAARATRVDARRLSTALADHSETLAGIERGVAVREWADEKKKTDMAAARAQGIGPRFWGTRWPPVDGQSVTRQRWSGR